MTRPSSSLRAVQEGIREALVTAGRSSRRVAGESRPPRGARTIRARPTSRVAGRARSSWRDAANARRIEVVCADRGRRTRTGAAPADLVLVCGVFGNSATGRRADGRALPTLCARGATVIWTRHRRRGRHDIVGGHAAGFDLATRVSSGAGSSCVGSRADRPGPPALQFLTERPGGPPDDDQPAAPVAATTARVSRSVLSASA